ncbi:MAG TPA: alpha/beta hydrolase-fold protein [Candidatus Limnocylindria bacterium]|nr:alpha/beta hydrolase-fold protein [Candidatus Limnocylindria bacterium]
MKQSSRWYSDRLGSEVSVVRWGHLGAPLLLFPTAGGDAEEIERFHCIRVLEPLLAEGRLKVYSCDSVAGQHMITGEGSIAHRCRLQDQFHEFVARELVPAIRQDCRSPEIEIISAGSSIGAFHALAVLCRYPHLFSRALCMSGTYDLRRFLKGEPTQEFYASSPIHFLSHAAGDHLAAVRKRFVLFASGQGRAEDIGESWHAAHVLGRHGIPNRVDPWGQEWNHDWPTWRAMLPLYLGEWTAREPVAQRA